MWPMTAQLADAHCAVSPRSAAQVHGRLMNPSNSCLLAAMVCARYRYSTRMRRVTKIDGRLRLALKKTRALFGRCAADRLGSRRPTAAWKNHAAGIMHLELTATPDRFLRHIQELHGHQALVKGWIASTPAKPAG
jgi:hypothetical protein